MNKYKRYIDGLHYYTVVSINYVIYLRTYFVLKDKIGLSQHSLEMIGVTHE